MTYEEAKKYWEVFLKEIEGLKKRHSCIDWEEQEKATKLAIEAIEKQIPKKPIIPWDSIDGKEVCPICRNLLLFGSEQKYCDECGQAIDWSEQDDK